jgi:hypothetical protein
MTIPPDYLEGKVAPPAKAGPASLLQDGQWCGHGEPTYNVFDICAGKENIFSVRLPVPDDEELNSPLVVARSDSGITFPVYDSHKHPASIYYAEDEPDEASRLQPAFRCPNCSQERFHVSVGFEIPSDSTDPNDTSWFALAIQCAACEWEGVIYDDETA